MKLPVAAVCLFAATPLFAQPTMPAWLALYPGASAQTKSYPAMVEATYTTDATPDAVLEHYRKLFEAQNLEFHANSDGMGMTVRGSVPECDLMLAIHAQGSGTQVRASCAVKTPTYTAVPEPMPQRVEGPGQAEIAERHSREAAEMGLRAERPPLVWPDWLTQLNGAKISPRKGTDRSGNATMTAEYSTPRSIDEVFGFYRSLLTKHEYTVKDGGSNIDGVNYPNGSPGPWTEIHVSFQRTRPNERTVLTVVTLRFTAFVDSGRKAM